MLTWLTLLWSSVPACFLLFNTRQKTVCAGIGCFSFIACFAFGFWQLQGVQAYHDDVVIKLVQPNIAQSEKWRGDQMFGHFRKTLALSENTEGQNKTTLIIWPETALSYRIFNAPGAAEELRSVLRSYPPSSALLTGMLRFDAAHAAYYNSLVMIGDNSELFNIYDKHHLVPFGEYIPFQQWIPLAPVVQFKGFEPGAGLKTMEAPSGVRYSPLICYEIVFPGRSMEQGTAPDFIVNVTNDAWYGESAGPYQHLTQALYRAVETGMPVIRAANTGFSAIISPYGRIEGKTELFKADSSTLKLPQAKPISDMIQRLKYRLIPIFFMLFIFAGAFSKRPFANAD
jgi:apolipoprotein N-acyltransferase